ncbi:NAD(P)-binding protein [Eremomyces bilateralis CBS 781.70]|uniref:NAD(P)-binding protein n=1 Tax=Eremomyces bilateralis CBS 781.70 TaxID=1392243 RepID=A0A6G1GFX8_9PEZI|nr:NAD(P)-binding protein [Eremomyces bilateralis CBS 781.70]KAF1816892.1 NAD(P)-binding protein [Eremomyces bilateralis CBS 781.70]
MEPQSSVLKKFSLHNRSIVITGAGRGLGLSFARALAELGANIIAIDVHDKPDEEFHDLLSYGVKTVYYKCDVRDPATLKATIGEAANKFGSINGCIAAAAIMTDKPFMEHTVDDMNASFAVNVNGMLSTVQICAEHMIKQKSGGTVICISSTAGHKAVFPQTATAYVCSKHAVLGLVRQAAAELAQHNIRVNSISPGPFLTKMLRSVIAGDPALEEYFSEGNAMKRLAVPEELDGAVGYLMSDASSFVTGNNFNIDGGSGCH